MSQEREAAFPIRDFQGVDRQIEREDIPVPGFYETRNLWEERLGTLETRRGSNTFAPIPPSNVTRVHRGHRIYKSDIDKTRFNSITCTPQTGDLANLLVGSLPANIAPAFVADGTAQWLVGAANPTEQRFDYEFIYLRLVGYGFDQSYKLVTADVTDYAFGVAARLDVTISTAFANKNITGVEIYASTDTGDGRQGLWVGYIDLIKTPTGTFGFKFAPKSKTPAFAGTFENGQTANPDHDYQVDIGKWTISEGTGGTLKKGKTYFVLIMSHHHKIDTVTAANQRSIWRAISITETAIKLPSITINNDNASILVTNTVPVNPQDVMLVAIGEDPQLLKPVQLWDGVSTAILDFPDNVPGVIDRTPNLITTAAANTDLIYSFAWSDYAYKDMLMRVDDAGAIFPLFISRIEALGNDPTLTSDRYDDEPGGVGFGIGFERRAFGLSTSSPVVEVGVESQFRFTSFQKVSYFVIDFIAWSRNRKSPQLVSTSRTNQSYFATDGFAAAPVIMEGQVILVSSGPDVFGFNPIQVILPPSRFISQYQETILIGGGDPATMDDPIDPNQGTLFDSSNTVFFSRGLDPNEFTNPSLATPVLNFFTLEVGGERINGFGIFATTSGDEALGTRLLVGKQSSLWSLKDIPTTASSFLDQLSGKIGFVSNEAVVQTPFGTMFAAIDNVYMVRDTGEPTPVGEQLEDVFERSLMVNAVAVYHDDQFKLSLHDPEEGGSESFNNTEWWLDLRKMKATRGQPSWKGPMTGRAVDHEIVEDKSGDGTSYDEGRDRVAVDSRNRRVYQADVLPVEETTIIKDFSLPVEWRLVTKDLVFGTQFADWNKLHTRQYWKLRVNSDFKANEITHVDGVLSETKAIQLTSNIAKFNDNPMTIFPTFPLGRLRGRTIRKELNGKGRVAIGGLSTYFKPERRKI